MTVAFYTLGCKVNLYETEYLMNQFTNKGYQIIPFNNKADIYIINTCTVTNTSDSKSRKMINKAIKQNKEAIVVVMGCYSQLKYEALSKIAGVDIIIGNKDKSKVIDYIEQYIKNKEPIVKIYDLSNEQFESMNLDTFYNRTRAFVKIQDGCNNYCSYCIIPYVRGSIRSKPHDEIIKEITNLVNKGYIEIVLTGIHTGSYGKDLNNDSFTLLLKDIVTIKKLQRLRISSIEITELNDNLLQLMKEYNVIADHLHIPLQSGSNKILKLMNRKYDTSYFEKVISEIRTIRPNIAITTDVIVGFPNETDDDFNNTYNFINRIKFAKLHVFPYSKRDNTRAAAMDNQIDNNIKKIRVNKLLTLSQQLEKEYMSKFLAKTLDILVETTKNGYYIGHTSNYLMIKTKAKIKYNEIVPIKINNVDYPYLIGEVDRSG